MWSNIIFVTLLLLLSQVTHQFPQDELTTETNNSIDVSAQTDCSTARKEKGFCVERQICDYGTAAIDRTLYAPKNYKKPCKLHEVCCPMESIIRQSNPMADDTKELNFDEDDKIED